MKNLAGLTFVLILIMSRLPCKAQSSFEGAIAFDFSIPISNFVEKGETNQFPVSAQSSLNEAFSGDVNWWPLRNLGFLTGISVHSFEYQIHHQIQIPGFVFHPGFTENRKLQVLGGSPAIGIIYRTGNLRARLRLTEFFPLEYKQSHKSFKTASYIFDHDYHVYVSVLSIDEQIDLIISPKEYIILQSSFQYKVFKGIFLNAGIETTLHKGKKYHYDLLIKRYPEGSMDEAEILNQFKVNTKYTAFNLGLYYIPEFKKSQHKL